MPLAHSLLRPFVVRPMPVLGLLLAVAGYAFGQASNSAAAAAPAAVPQAADEKATDKNVATPTVKVATRLVSLEVVVRDHQGHPIPGLTAKDFEVTEQIVPRKDRRAQTIAAFHAINWADLKAASAKPAALPPGIYSNTNQPAALVPPTVLLFDGINTDLESQLQVHQQMVKMLNSIPADIPVAVFLMGDQLRLLQTFTTDPKLLRDATAKTLAVGKVAPDQDPLDDPNALSAELETIPSNQLPPGALASLESFEQHAFSFALGIRVQKTLDALRGLARYLDAYPGRKNVLWISTSFPLMYWPSDSGGSANLADFRGFSGEMQEVGSALNDAKIAIYPLDPGGVRTQSMFEASARVRQPNSGQRMGQAIQREDTLQQAAQQTMRDIADETGGLVCLGDNDLGDCVKKAVADSNSYYELAYYPDAGDWRGEYHRIVVKAARSGVHLSYREGYYARPLEKEKQETPAAPGAQPEDPALRRAACEDPLTATAVPFMVQSIPPDQAGAAKYFLGIDSRTLTFTSPEAGAHLLGLSVAACTFDKAGQPMQYLQTNSVAKLNDQQFAAAAHAVTKTFQFPPKAGVARVRLLVRDSVSGRIGSVDIPYVETHPAPTLLSPAPAGARQAPSAKQ